MSLENVLNTGYDNLTIMTFCEDVGVTLWIIISIYIALATLYMMQFYERADVNKS